MVVDYECEELIRTSHPKFSPTYECNARRMKITSMFNCENYDGEGNICPRHSNLDATAL